jgi:dipeptidase E
VQRRTHRARSVGNPGRVCRIRVVPFVGGWGATTVRGSLLDHYSFQETTLKLLLTAGGVTNPSIRDALVELLGKPIAESTALCIPTAMYGHPSVGPGVKAWQFISGHSENPMVELGWKSVGVLELTALPSIGRERWVPRVREADALLVAGGDVLYLCHWMRESGLLDLLPSLSETVWVGLSAGSMVMTPTVGDDFIQWRPPSGDTSTLGVVDFSICPHLAADGMPGNSMAEAEQWAAGIPNTAYAMDDQTAIAVVDGDVEFVSEGRWEQLRSLTSEPDKRGTRPAHR